MKRALREECHDAVARCVCGGVTGERIANQGRGSDDHADALAGVGMHLILKGGSHLII